MPKRGTNPSDFDGKSWQDVLPDQRQLARKEQQRKNATSPSPSLEGNVTPPNTPPHRKNSCRG